VTSFHFQPADAPGRSGAAPAEAQGSTAQPAQPGGAGEGAPPASAWSGMGSMLFLLLPLALIFFMTRNQNKKQKELESSLKVGDRVITRAGAIGKIVDISERTMRLELAPGVNVTFLKTAVEGLDTTEPKPGAQKTAAKDAPSKESASKDAASKDSKDTASKDSKKG
jgi:preprotein translocase subunit YajC